MIDEEDSRLETNVKYSLSLLKLRGLRRGRSPIPTSFPSPCMNYTLPPPSVHILSKQQSFNPVKTLF